MNIICLLGVVQQDKQGQFRRDLVKIIYVYLSSYLDILFVHMLAVTIMMTFRCNKYI